jgi:hypothetical protein
MMGDAFVAIDAGFLPSEQQSLVLVDCAWALARNVHRLRTMAVTAFERIIGFHASPLVHRKFEAVIEKLLTRVDHAKDLPPHLLDPYGRLLNSA